MSRFSCFLALTVGLTSGSFASAQMSSRWTVLTTTNSTIVSFDSSSVVRKAPRSYHAWLRFDHEPRDSVVVAYSKKGYDYRLTRYQIDCADSRFGTIGATYYDSTGNVVHSFDVAEPKWSLVLPESVGEDFVRAFCRAFETPTTSTELWLIKDAVVGARLSKLRLSLLEGDFLDIESTVNTTHRFLIDTTTLVGARKDGAATANALSDSLTMRGQSYNAFGLTAGTYSVFCELHPRNFRERLQLIVLPKPKGRGSALSLNPARYSIGPQPHR
jgi:hypothetical protein